MNFKNKRPRGSGGRGGCFCGGKFDKKVTGYAKPKYTDPPEEAPATSRRKKNRRKWCRGRAGVAHKPRWVPDPGYASFDLMRAQRGVEKEHEHQIYACEVCGKHLDHRTLHLPCGQVHSGFGYSYYFMNRETGKYERKPYPCEEEAA